MYAPQCSVFIFVRLYVCSFMFVYVRLRSFTSAPPPVCCVHKHSPFTNVRLRSFICSGRCEQGTWGCSKTPVWERMTWVVFKNTGFGDVHVEIITLELNHLNVVTVQLLQCLCMLLFTLSLPVTSSNTGRGQLCLKSCSFTPLLLYLEHVAPSLIPPPLCLGPPLSWGGSPSTLGELRRVFGHYQGDKKASK